MHLSYPPRALSQVRSVVVKTQRQDGIRVRAHDLETLEDYREAYHDESLWRPLVEGIAGRHGLPCELLTRSPDGTHIVYFVSDSHVIKVFSPHFPGDIVAERLVTRRLEGRLGVGSPAVVAEGEWNGWPYLVLTRVPGRPADALWPELNREERLTVVREVGGFIRTVRGVRTVGLEAIALDWPDLVREQLESAPQRDAPTGIAVSPEALRSLLDAAPRDALECDEPVLLLADITDEHVLVRREGGATRVTGLVDFGDAFLGHPDYELVAPGLTLARGDPELLRALLSSAGYDVDKSARELRLRLMVQTLIHRYATLRDVVRVVPGAGGAKNIMELSRRLWPVDMDGEER